MEFKPKTVLLGVTGGIAAYKAADLVSRLKKGGMDVCVVMTENACEFITPLTFETLSNNPVVYDMFERKNSWDVEHISLSKRADIFVVAPATANIIGKIDNGIADDMLSTTIMAAKCPKLIAPAMNTGMFESVEVQSNIKSLTDKGIHFIMPESGRLACGDIGLGKLASVDDIYKKICEILKLERIYEGKKILVTAGPTREAIDPVRFISNRSSGKMGFALAYEALQMGAEVILVCGPNNIKDIDGINTIRVQTTQEMKHAVDAFYDECDMVVMAAAPSDYAVETVSDQKIKKGEEQFNLTLKRNPDILKGLGERKTKQVLIGFAAETQNIEEYAKKKLLEKNLDMIVANDVKQDGAGFDVDTNAVICYKRNVSNVAFEGTKLSVAKDILKEAKAFFD